MWAAALLTVLTAASPAVDVEVAIRAYNAASERPLPKLRARELRELRAGRIVRRYIAPTKRGGAAGVLGMIVAEVPQDWLWLTIRDGHLAVTEGLTERHISGAYDEADQRWFGSLTFPPPFRPRHWRIHTRTQVKLSRKTRGMAWESTWTRVPDGAKRNRADAVAGKLEGVTPEDIDRAIYTVENHGSWLVIRIGPRRSLLVYRAYADLGGVIPHELVNAFARMRLKELLRGTLSQVERAQAHYVGDHEEILGGDGRVIPTGR